MRRAVVAGERTTKTQLLLGVGCLLQTRIQPGIVTEYRSGSCHVISRFRALRTVEDPCIMDHKLYTLVSVLSVIGDCIPGLTTEWR